MWLGLGSVGLAALIAGLAAPRISAWRTRARAADHMAELSRCLFGATGDVDSKLLRARQLGASATAGAGDAETRPWPEPCRKAALELELDVRAMERTRRGRCGPERCCPEDDQCASLAELGAALEAFRLANRAAELAPVAPGALDALGALSALPELARRAGIDPRVTATGPEPPAPAKLWVPGRLSPIDRGPAELLTDPPGDATLTLLFHERAVRSRLCTIALAGAPAAPCQELGAEVGRGAAPQLLAGARGAPRLLLVAPPSAAEPAEQGAAAAGPKLVDAATGRSLATLPAGAVDGYVWPDGQVAVLVAATQAEPAKLWRTGPGGARAQTDLPSPATLGFGPALAFDELVWSERAAQDGHRVFAAHISPAEAALGLPRELGSVAGLGGGVEVETCRTDELLTVLARGEPRDLRTPAAMLLRSAQGWQTPLALDVASDWFGLTCYGSTASVSWLEPEDEQQLAGRPGASPPIRGTYAVHRLQCTVAGCTEEQSEVTLERWSRASRYVFADLGSTVLLLWRSPFGDVRARIGPCSELGKLPEVPLFDDEAHGGFAWELGRGSVFARAAAAVVLVKGSPADGDITYALRIAASGEVLPVAVLR
jgi:hypothetical protein